MLNQPKVSLSVVILTKNEEKRLPDCLASVAWASDLIILDDESTDQTESVAKQYQARFIRRKMDNEGRHRNFGYAQGKETWVLSLDADERISPELAAEIKTFLSNPPQDLNGCNIPRKNYIGNYWIQYGGWYPSAQLRLFKRNVFKYKEDEVHPVALMEGKTKTLQGDIIHYSYRNFDDFISKLNKQTTLEATKWFRTERHVSLTHALWRAVDRFFRSYVKKRGYKDGFIGFMVSVFSSLYQILSYAKYWEMKHLGNSFLSNR